MNTASLPDDPEITRTLAEMNGTGSIDVLHVDDDVEFAEVTAIFLERTDTSLSVNTAADATEGLDALRGGNYHCVVSDYEMPGPNGLEFLEEVREGFPDLPFFLFTGKGSEQIASEAISAGVTDYLQKRSGTEQYELLANRIRNAVRATRAEQEIQQGFTAMETAREGISILDTQGTFRYVNPAYAEIYGYERTDLIGEHWELLYPEAEVEATYQEVLPAVPEDGHWRGESVHLTAGGERILVDHVLAYTATSSLICTVQEVQKATLTERELARERRRFQLFVDAIEDYAVWDLDTEGNVTSWNEGAADLLGYPTDEVVGQHLDVCLPPGVAVEGDQRALLERAIEDGRTTYHGDLVTAEGSRFPATLEVVRIDDEAGLLTGFGVVLRDRRPELADDGEPTDCDGLLERALDVLEDVFYVLDTDGDIVKVTDRAAEVTGYDREELLAMAPTDLFPESERERVRKDIEEALATEVAHVEVDLVTADGRRIPFEFRKRRLTDADGRVVGLAGIGRDVSERKRRERQLQSQIAQFEHFGNVLSHDLRTPLNTAMGRLELYRETGDAGNLDAVDTNLHRLDELIDDLSSVMREGELVGDLAPVALGPTVRSVWDSLPTAAATLHVRVDDGIRADETALKRLVENLFKNALDHVGEEVTVTLRRLPDGFAIDDGAGIGADDRERLFEAGYTTRESGSGFGLASARQIAIAHGWELSVADSPAGGARFEVRGVTWAD